MLCETEREIFSADSRETIFQVARKYLEQLGVTGTELVFSPNLHQRIQSDGTRFQELTQAIAVLQGNQVKKPVSERLRDVIRFADLGMKRVADMAQQLSEDPIADVRRLAELASSDPQDGIVKSGVALAKALAAIREWSGKLKICRDYLKQTEDEALLASLDQTASELLRLKPAADLVFGPGGDNARLVRNCLALAGDAQAAAELRETEEIKHWIDAIGGRPMPRILAATRLRLRDVLAGPKVLADEDPKREWAAIGELRSRIAALPTLSGEKEFYPLLTRRTNILAGNEKLTALLADESQVARKMIIVIGLLGEIDDTNLRSNLLTMLGHYFELPDLKKKFAGSDRSQIPALLKAVKTALSNAHVADYRKSRFEEILNNHFGALEAADKRQSDRSLAGPDDMVLVGQDRFKLRNWSPRGLLFAPATPELRVGQKLLVTVLIRNAILTLNFDADAEVVRVTGNVVAVQYKFRDGQAEQKVKLYFR